MLEYLIPNALAQGANTQNSEESATGIAGMIEYVWTHLDNWIGGIVILVLFYIIGTALSKSATNHLMRAKGESMPENVLTLVDRLIKVGIISIGVVIAGSMNGIELGVLLGAVGFGFGFALKDIIGNMISSVIMLAQKHVNIGDLVEVAGTIGTISSIDTRVTVLQSLEGHKVVIPNQQMINEKIVSYTSNPFRRLEIFTYISWDSDLEKGMNLVREVLNQYSEIVKQPEPSVLLDNIEDESNFAIRVLFWIDSSKNWLDIQSNVHHRILKAFGEAGIDIAYPVRSLTISENVHDTLQVMKNIKEGIVPEEIEVDLPDSKLMAAAKSTKDSIIPQRLKEEVPVNLVRSQTSTPSNNQSVSQPAPINIPISSNSQINQASPASQVSSPQSIPSAPISTAQTRNEIPVAPGAPKIDLNPGQ